MDDNIYYKSFTLKCLRLFAASWSESGIEQSTVFNLSSVDVILVVKRSSSRSNPSQLTAAICKIHKR